MAERQPCIVFLHIPKTGGVSLRAALRQKYPGANLTLHSPRDPARVEELPIERRRRARVVAGHLPYGVHRHMPLNCEYVTMLREPVGRAVSTYHHVLEHPQHWFHEQAIASGMDLESFVAADDGPLDNLQTRLLSGWVEGELVARDEPRTPATEAGLSALEEAKLNLDRCLVVGLTERFDESFILLRRALGWKLPMYAKRNKGTHAGRKPPGELAIEMIKQRDQLDVLLYAHAQGLMDAAVRAGGPGFKREVAAFAVLNRVPNAIGPRIPASLRNPLHTARNRGMAAHRWSSKQDPSTAGR